MLVVQKYGGSSLKSASDIKNIASRIRDLYQKKNNIIVVVSAMGNTTNELTELALKVSKRPEQRELDMLLTTGERISMALLSMALNDLDVPAISFTGSQSGVLTDDAFNNAHIIDIKPIRVKESLDQGKVVVLAGFQGVSPKTKEITTLGRGGSDTTAIAMAAFFKAKRCEILKDVDGIASADPKLVPNAKIIKSISYDNLAEMTFWGAKFLHYRGAELASALKVPMYIGPSAKNAEGTIIEGDSQMYESEKFLSVNSHRFVRSIEIKGKDIGDALEILQSQLSQQQLPTLQILHSQKNNNGFAFLVAGPKEQVEPLHPLLTQTDELKVLNDELSTVTVTCVGLIGTGKITSLCAKLKSAGVNTKNIIKSPMSITFLINATDREKAIKALHEQ